MAVAVRVVEMDEQLQLRDETSRESTPAHISQSTPRANFTFNFYRLSLLFKNHTQFIPSIHIISIYHFP
jgi:hypothetical protein